MSSAAKKRHSVDELRVIVAPLAERYGVSKVYIFGSVARGDFNENSDYDFYIELNEVWGLLRLSGFFLDLSDAVGDEIDLLDNISVSPDFLNKIRAEGVVLYEG
jgi:predicted nucleotidyltransferase